MRDAHVDLDAPRMSSRLVLYSAVIAVVGGAMVGGVCGFSYGRGADQPAAHAPGQALIEEQAGGVLGELRATWDPRHRARILATAQTATPRVVSVLHAVLLLGERTSWLGEAIDYAAASGRPELRSALEGLIADRAVSSASRVKAIRAAQQIAAWPEADVRRWMESEDEELRGVGLELALAGAGSLAVQSIELITHQNQRVREAAVQALRRSDPVVIASSLWGMVRLGGEDGASAMQAMAELGFVASAEGEVLAGLDQLAPAVQRWALEFLGKKQAPLADAAPVLALARDLGATDLLRARALYCLEQTGSFDPAQADSLIFVLEPLERYFVARCLLARGDARGIDVLGELVEGEVGDVRTASLLLLAWYGGQSTTSDSARLREAAVQALRGPRQLPATELLAVLAGGRQA